MSFIDNVLDSIKDFDFERAQRQAQRTTRKNVRNARRYTSDKYEDAQNYAADKYDAASTALAGASHYVDRTYTSDNPDYARGFLAGLIGGLVGTGVKMLVDRSMPTSQPHSEHDARLQVVEGAEELTNTDMNRNQEETAQQALNIGFGALAGGVYGVMTEAMPAMQVPAGIPFGAALWTLTHKAALPALGLTPGPLEQNVGTQAGQLAGHIAYGITVELVRRAVRHVLDEEDLL